MKGKNNSGTQVINAPFGKKTDFDFKARLEKTFPSYGFVWAHWTMKGNFGIDKVVKVNCIVKTQLSIDHRKNFEE